ncbi:hypothetical protein A7X67_00285 [Clostridium sp. W14A]|nr:hypothetical protein A7X67_00285 [Clostridium sp. W14A]
MPESDWETVLCAEDVSEEPDDGDSEDKFSAAEPVPELTAFPPLRVPQPAMVKIKTDKQNAENFVAFIDFISFKN